MKHVMDFRNHHKPNATLTECPDTVKPQLPTETRWKSQPICIDTFIKNRSSYMNIVHKHEDDFDKQISRKIQDISIYLVKETLEHRGVLNQLKARIRAEVFSALDDQAEEKPSLSNENLLINELIREYLEYNKYKYTASVLQAESGQPVQHLDREFLAKELNIIDDKSTEGVPLLYGILAYFVEHSKNIKAVDMIRS
ncbi:hypothetical protein LSH36_34g01078 [Paralvinella palmiformis]|uniref:Centrosomal protein 20 n=1 Tax=Paralvinella palmiformis TaxID=53620 RepID=A0AAD9K979_9ANNE|nr:hypothetical protein LSH36_34g01078 [Paralvinella palmiformis]